MDNKLLVNGYFKEQAFLAAGYPKEEEQFHESKFRFSPHEPILESLYKLHESEDMRLTFLAGSRYWYEAMPKFDSDSGRHIAIPH